MKVNVDINALEQQRYDKIKASGNYLEVDILIGTEKEEHNGTSCKLPIVRTSMQNVGIEEVANLYTILNSLVDMCEQKYPAACIIADAVMSCKRWTVESEPNSTVEVDVATNNEEE